MLSKLLIRRTKSTPKASYSLSLAAQFINPTIRLSKLNFGTSVNFARNKTTAAGDKVLLGKNKDDITAIDKDDASVTLLYCKHNRIKYYCIECGGSRYSIRVY
jgi:hypothetical protein